MEANISDILLKAPVQGYSSTCNKQIYLFNFANDLGRMANQVEAPRPRFEMLPAEHHLNREITFHEPSAGLDHKEVIKCLLPYLGKKDFKPLRSVCYNWNLGIIFFPSKRQIAFKGKLHEKWYSDAAGFNHELAPVLNTIELSHFSYRRKSDLFKNYWHNAASVLKTLNLSHCSLECVGFIFILNHCPVLQNLNLKNCKLRDLDDFHTTPKRRREDPNSVVVPLPISAPIRHLSIDSMYKIEHCFIEYLIQRTGHLESITIKNCFHPEVSKDNLPVEDTLPRYMEFERNLLTLIAGNRTTLQKYGLHENNYQLDFLGRMPQTTLREFALTLLPDPTSDYASAVRFVSSIQGLEKLDLECKGGIKAGVLRNMIYPLRGTLRKFSFTFRGDLFPTGSNYDMDFMQEFTALESFLMKDSKGLVPNDLCRLLGGRRKVRKVRRNRPDVDAMIKKSITPVGPECLLNLTNTLRELVIDKYIPSTNFLTAVPTNPRAMEYLENLTILEIRGPWIFDMTGVIGTISEKMRNLVTLTLRACGINDTHMTDLNAAAVKDMRSCLTAGLSLFTPTSRPSRDAVVQAVNRVANRRRLSDLPNLRHLDLSKNPHISDVSLFDALRIPHLVTLNLDGCARITNWGAEFIPASMPALEEINLKNCPKVSKLALDSLVTHCKRLRRLHTTRIVQSQELEGFDIQLNPNYSDIVHVTPLVAVAAAVGAAE